jgi:ankyrin repeat protein
MLPSLANLSVDAVFVYRDADGLRADAQARGIDRIFNTECVSCLDAFEEGEEVEVLGCGHAMHLRCAQRWYEQPGKEPVCFLCKTHELTAAERDEVEYVGGEEEDEDDEDEDDEDEDEEEAHEIVRAAADGNLARVQELLVAGADVNWVLYGSNTALMWASVRGHAAIVELLLTAPDIDVNYKNGDGDTALMYASATDRIAIVEMLLDAPGIRVNIKDNGGWTALMQASGSGRAAVAIRRLLRAAGAR